METCKYVHYEVDAQMTKLKVDLEPVIPGQTNLNRTGETSVLYPAQWIQCDLRSLDMGILGELFLYLQKIRAFSTRISVPFFELDQI